MNDFGQPKAISEPAAGRALHCGGENGWQNALRLLVVRLDNLGDVILTGPALRAIKESRPESSLTLLASPAGARAAPLLPWLDDTLVWRALWQEVGTRTFAVEEERRLVETLREGTYDAALILTSFSQSPHPPALACLLAGIPLRAGESKESDPGVLTHLIPAAHDSLHQTDRNLRLARSLGFTSNDSSLQIRVAEKARKPAHRLLAEAGIAPSSYVLLAPGASAPARSYPMARYAAAAAEIAAASRLPVVVTGSASEAGDTASALAQVSDQAISLVGRTDIAELAALVDGAKLVICNNSLPLHLADALDVPVVCLYSGTELISQWEPRRSPARLLRRNVWCSPCYFLNCPFELQCLDVEPHEVASAALELLDCGSHPRGAG